MKRLLLTLLLTSSFSTFADSHLDFTLSDFCYLQPGIQDRGGVYYFPNEEVGITATSICIYKDAYGQYASKGELKNGRFFGKWTRWYTNGQILSEDNYCCWYDKDKLKDGKLNGKSTAWHENGQIYLEGNFKDNKQVGSWTEWHENGQIVWVRNYKDGVCISGNC